MYELKIKSKRSIKDAVCMDIPSLIYAMEYVNGKTDVELHAYAEKLVALSRDYGYITMEHLTKIS